MPELPEVENVKQGLQQLITGKMIIGSAGLMG
ncbi:MAG: DNA-formamidopyrimidine glycosylase family protein [Alkalibacterium sp.]|nr:DNA-formamidopyrimidine glycosylase family protein [Alkalibacterium sp.]